MKKTVIDLKGNKIEEITLSDDVFKIEPNESVLSQYVRIFRSNQRQGTSNTKTRGDVSGGGAKPWKQKGTGRARSGSNRSPIWVHGGVAHGPHPKSWTLKFPKKMGQLAMKSALSLKESADSIKVVSEVKFEKPSTKVFLNLLKELKLSGKTLYIWHDKNEAVLKSASNIPELTTEFSGILNAYDLISADNVVFDKNAILEIDKRYKK